MLFKISTFAFHRRKQAVRVVRLVNDERIFSLTFKARPLHAEMYQRLPRCKLKRHRLPFPPLSRQLYSSVLHRQVLTNDRSALAHSVPISSPALYRNNLLLMCSCIGAAGAQANDAITRALTALIWQLSVWALTTLSRCQIRDWPW